MCSKALVRIGSCMKFWLHVNFKPLQIPSRIRSSNSKYQTSRTLLSKFAQGLIYSILRFNFHSDQVILSVIDLTFVIDSQGCGFLSEYKNTKCYRFLISELHFYCKTYFIGDIL